MRLLLVGRGVATSHNRTVPSASPVARVLPSGLNATQSTEPVLLRERPIGWRVGTSHNCTVSSAAPLARVLPSGLNATESTAPL